VLAAWEHYNIQFLTAELGVPKAGIPYWSDADYDTVYVLSLTLTPNPYLTLTPNPNLTLTPKPKPKPNLTLSRCST
jgi:hypothetical protein